VECVGASVRKGPHIVARPGVAALKGRKNEQARRGGAPAGPG
jgi:hypothetical protein